MGSTLIGAAFSEQGVEWISVGDSPLYLYRRGEIALLNEDHSLAPELDRLVAAGRLSPAEARRDPRRRDHVGNSTAAERWRARRIEAQARTRPRRGGAS